MAVAKWDLERTLDAINTTWAERATYRGITQKWEDMWALRVWTEDDYIYAREEGRELVTLEHPRNVADMAKRLLGDKFIIKCPADDVDEGSYLAAEAREKFLKTLWQQQKKFKDVDPFDALKWHAVVRGRVALKVQWVYDVLPSMQKEYSPPIRFLPVDPKDIGVHRGELMPMWAFHKYDLEYRQAKQRWPDLELDKKYQPEDIVCVTDFWYMDEKSGSIWHSVLAEDLFVIEPKRSKYPCIPIIERVCDPVPLADEELKGASILESLRPNIRNRNVAASMLMTALGREFWRSSHIVNDNNEPIPDPDTSMGAVNKYPAGTKFIGPPGPAVDIGLLEKFWAVMEANAEQATFSKAMWGEIDSMRAGYGLVLASSMTKTRIGATQKPLIDVMEEANQIALALVEKFAGPDGVKLYGYDDAERSMNAYTLLPEQIAGIHANTIVMRDNVPADEMQRSMMLMQLSSGGVLSKRTVRDNLPVDIPDDEEIQALVERAIEQDPDLLRMQMRRAFEMKFGIPMPFPEPDFKDTQAEQMAMMQQMMQQQMMAAQQAQQQQMQAQVPQYLPPEMNGMMQPEQLGIPGQGAPTQFDVAQGQTPSPEELMARAQRGAL